jgi:hypothetical protein
MGENRSAYRILVAKQEGKRTLGRPGCRWVDDIEMDHTEIGSDGMDWISGAEDRNQWRTHGNTVINLLVPFFFIYLFVANLQSTP